MKGKKIKKQQLIVDELISGVFKPGITLRELFNQRLDELSVKPTEALDIINIQHRTLNGILDGTQKTVDYTNFIKIADFLQISKEELFNMYIDELKKNFQIGTAARSEAIKFIKENFDLGALKKAGFISSISDFGDIESKLVSFLGLKTIFEYSRPKKEAAFSSGKVEPKNELNRGLWVQTARNIFEEIDNPNGYDRDQLVEYFPEIRWHSTSVELGLVNVIRALYKLGVTVIFQPSLPSLHLRGATFSVNGKPCVVLTDYRGFYPTLWFALIHELFHVIFDWEEIKSSRYHLSDEKNEQLSVVEKEQEADNFARSYLFSNEKTNAIKPYISNKNYVKRFAKENHVHPSFIYVFNAYDSGGKDKYAWAQAHRENPDIKTLLKPLGNPWAKALPVREFVNSLKHKYYN